MMGYNGKILHVDLNNSFTEVEEPDETFYRTYFGGSAMGLYYLFKHTPKGTDPLSPENILTFMLGPLVSAPISGQSRCTVTAKSPLTDCVGDSQAGGFWPAKLKSAGFDGIVVHGASRKPVYLWIHDGKTELRDASHLWGKLTYSVEELLKQELGDEKIEVAQCGQSGELLVRFAAIMSMCNRAFGRTGMGAVMGSKLLKAIAVQGSRPIEIADMKHLMDMTRRGTKDIPKIADMADLGKFGTARLVGAQELYGGQVTRNWQSGSMGVDRAEMIDGPTMYRTMLRGSQEGSQDRLGRGTCYACAVRCKRVIEAEWQNNRIGYEYGGPEYESVSTFGSFCDVTDLGAIVYANQLCNSFGVDTITCGATIAFAFECYEKGLITKKDTDGIELNWGNAESMIDLLEKILRREGIGDLLAEGSARAAEKIGHGAEDFVMSVKNQEAPAHMPHVKRSLALIYAVNPFGADHMSAEHDPVYTPESYTGRYEQNLRQIGLVNPQPEKVLNREKVNWTLTTQYASSALDSIPVCQFVFGPAWTLYNLGELVEAINAVTGWEITIDELMKLGERRLNMMRAYNARDGITRERDTLPKRWFDEPLKGGPSEGDHVDRTEWLTALDTYYEMAGWNVFTGNPTRTSLENVGLGWIADIIES
jgi:aldehyde:ferredoxin oxidoreductase